MARSERSAGFIIFHIARADDATSFEYLVLNYGSYWDFPKGHLEAGEDDMAAALRELREETGVTQVRQVPRFCEEIGYYFRHSKRGLVHKSVAFFLGEVRSTTVDLSREHAGYEFLPFDLAVNRVTYGSAKQVLRRAHEHLVTASKQAEAGTTQ